MDEYLKKNLTRIKLALCFLAALLTGLAVTGAFGRLPWPGKKTLTIGVFSDSYWEVQNGYSYRILDDAIALFEQEHPGIRVSYESGILKEDYSEWLAEKLLMGEAPDLFFVLENDFNDFAQIRALADLSSLIRKDAAFDPERYYQAAYECGKYDNIQYALPYECAPRIMFVNKSILDAEQIPIPQGDWTWEDFYGICKQVTKDRNHNGILDQYGAAGYGWQDAFDSNGVTLFNRQGTECYLTGDKVLEAISFMERMEQLNDGYSVTGRDFTLGNVAFQPLLFSEYRAYKSYPLSIKKYSGFEWDCITMPAGPQGENLSRLDTLSIAMNARTAHGAEAWEFMKLLTGDERIQSEIFRYSEGISVLPSVTGSRQTREVLMDHAGEGNALNMEILKTAMEKAVVVPGFRNQDLAMETVSKAVDAVIHGDSNISMELIIQNREINRYLQSLQQ